MRLRAAIALFGGCLVAALAAWPAAAEPACELDRPVVFAGLDWDSNAFHNALARTILEEGYGCQTDEIPGSTLPLLAGLGKGDVDVAMEVWKDNVTEPWDKALAAGKVVELGTNFPDAVQGWWVPRYLVEGDAERGVAARAPDLRHVRDLPKHKALFRDPEEPDKGRFYNCILGWNCEVVNSNKLKAYGLDAHFTNFHPGTGAALAAAIASAYKRRKPFVAYYWGPTWVLGKYDLVMLEEPPYNARDWELLAERKGDHDRPVAYPVVEVVVGANAEFVEAAPGLADFLRRYQTSNALVSRALAFMQEERGRTPKDAAEHFLRTETEIWAAWLPDEVRRRVAASLN
ncbi:MAG: ABC transporter substrate-binding protein [Alphaproteobacteria bacterium]|nr:ABC transporter substrate-binding protein [Alphaproteobacteria bacterium]